MPPIPATGVQKFSRWYRLIMAVAILGAAVVPLMGYSAPEPSPVDVIEHVDSGVINWSTGSLHAVGVSSPLAIDATAGDIQERVLMAAKANAYTRMMLTARQVRIRSGLTLGDVMDETPRVADGFRALLQNLPVAGQRYLSDGTAEIELILPLYGGPAQLLLPEDIRQVQPIKAVSQPPSAPSKGIEQASPEAPSAPKEPPYTGWILDARGTGARAAMTVAVRDESGRTVYGSAFVSREFAVHTGMSGYSTVLEPAGAPARVGDRPMTTRVLRAVGEARSDLVVSNADAAGLRRVVAHLEFLRECRVLVVVDPVP